MIIHNDELSRSKALLRAQALQRRELVRTPEARAFAKRLAEIGAGLAAEYKSEVASGFWPIKNEPSTLLLLDTLAGRGLVTALPVMVGRDQPLTFRAWKQGGPAPWRSR